MSVPYVYSEESNTSLLSRNVERVKDGEALKGFRNEGDASTVDIARLQQSLSLASRPTITVTKNVSSTPFLYLQVLFLYYFFFCLYLVF